MCWHFRYTLVFSSLLTALVSTVKWKTRREISNVRGERKQLHMEWKMQYDDSVNGQVIINSWEFQVTLIRGVMCFFLVTSNLYVGTGVEYIYRYS
jgi:F0F1-type ATP synthase membrane subunit a